MTKPQFIEQQLNSIKNFPSCWVYREGKRYIVQSRETGETIKSVYSYAEIETWLKEVKLNYER